MEVHDRDGRVLYRWAMAHPMIRRSEVFDRDGADEPSTVMWAAERGAFSLVVPNLPTGTDLVLLASPTEDLEILAPASEILRVPLREREAEPDERLDQHGEDPS